MWIGLVYLIHYLHRSWGVKTFVFILSAALCFSFVPLFRSAVVTSLWPIIQSLWKTEICSERFLPENKEVQLQSQAFHSARHTFKLSVINWADLLLSVSVVYRQPQSWVNRKQPSDARHSICGVIWGEAKGGFALWETLFVLLQHSKMFVCSVNSVTVLLVSAHKC